MDKSLLVLIYSLSSVGFLFVISKILGKKQLAQLDFVDYVVGISIGSIAAEWATDTSETPYYLYLLAMSVFLFFCLAVMVLERKGPLLKRILKGKPLTIIYDGRIDYKALKSSRLDINDLLALAREKGYFDLADIAFAVFECSGTLSILPKEAVRPATAGDLAACNSTATAQDVHAQLSARSALPCYLVIDGKISFSGLNELQKDTDWLFERLGLTQKSELKNILLASYSKEELTVTYKE